jgi:hypothetical protein
MPNMLKDRCIEGWEFERCYSKVSLTNGSAQMMITLEYILHHDEQVLAT